MITILPDSIRVSAGKFPDKAAFKCGSNVLSYSQLLVKMNQLSNVIAEQGVKKGDRVGILLPRSIETAIATYGVMNLGAIYVPIDPFAPGERISHIIGDCGIQCMITSDSQKKKIDGLQKTNSALKTIIGVESGTHISWNEVARAREEFTSSESILEEDGAYMMYTSGTTGPPKGMLHTHRSGLSYARHSAKLYDISSSDIIGNHSPIHFDISTLGYFTSPFVGATTIISPEMHVKMPASLSQLIEKEKVTIWYSVPTALIQMLEFGAMDQRDFSSLRWVHYAGEPFHAKHIKRLMKLLPETRFSNVFGPSEVNQCTYYNIDTVPNENDVIPIGRPWPGAEVKILDENDLEVELGETGELMVRTSTMMQGYWNRPELNEKAFYYETIDGGYQKKFYRTGDLVFENNERQLMFIGRRDRQVKIQGFRIELDEVESVLIGHPDVQEAAVFVQDKEEEKTLVAVAIPRESRMTEKEVLNYMRDKLPKYAVPEKIVFVEDIPRTSTEKIDYQGLAKGELL